MFFLAGCVHQQSRSAPRSKFSKATDWAQQRAIIAKAVSLMRKHLREPCAELRNSLYAMRRRAESVQEYTGKQIWRTAIRSIHRRDVRVMEAARKGMFHPEASSLWAYQTARDDTERYNARHGTGMIPGSVPALEDMIRFGKRHTPPTAKPALANSHAPQSKAKARRRSSAANKQSGAIQPRSGADS